MSTTEILARLATLTPEERAQIRELQCNQYGYNRGEGDAALMPVEGQQ